MDDSRDTAGETSPNDPKSSGELGFSSAPAPRHRLSRLLVLMLLMVGLGVTFFVLNYKSPPRSADALGARLELAAGEVSVDEGDGVHRAFSGSALLTGARIEATAGARALLRLSDGAAVFMRGGTKLKLDGNAIALETGEVWIDAPPTDRKPGIHRLGEIEVTATDAGFSLKQSGDAKNPTATVYVARGLAVVTSPGGRVEIQAGEQATVSGKAQPAVAPVAFWSDWTGGMGDHPASTSLSGAGTLYGIEQGVYGAPAKALEISRQSVRAVIRSGFAETEVDQTFLNPGDRPVEGWYWFTVPEGASVTGFALETNGQLVEGELIERREAAAQYAVAVATGNDPALLEWIDGRTYRARIFPVPQGGTRRVVVRYLELLPMVSGRLHYLYPMQSRNAVRIGEFSLSVDLGDAGRNMKLTTLAEARIEDGGRLVTMRRSGFTPRTDFQLEGVPSSEGPTVTVARYAPGMDTADYLMMRYRPDVDWGTLKAQPSEVVVVVDTSAAGDDASRQLKAAAAEAVIRALSDTDKFALISLDVKPTVLHPKEGLAPATEAEIAIALERLAENSAGGATDLGAMFDVALERLHGGDQPAIVYVGDGIATSGETTAEKLVERLRRALSTSRARLFTVGVGDANQGLLNALARAGGGQAFAVEAADQATERALRLASALKAPTITELDIDFGAGLDEVFLTANGKVTRGDEVILLARTHHDLPTSVKVKGRVGGKTFEVEHRISLESTASASLVPRLWAAEYIRRTLGGADNPEDVRGKVTNIGIEYGLMTPYTSFLALESEAAYYQQGIQRRNSPLRGVRLSSITAMNDVPTPLMAVGLAVGALGMGCQSQDAPEPEAMYAAKESYRRDQNEVIAMRAQPDVQAGAPAAAMPSVAAPMPPGAPPARMEAMKSLGYAGDGNAQPAVSSRGRRQDAPSRAPAELDAAPVNEIGDSGMIAKEEKRAFADDEMGKDKAGNKKGDFDALAATGARANVAPMARPVTLELRTCSDVAERPLAERSILWKQRLKTAKNAYELVNRYEAARSACELPDWRAEALFLRLLQRHVNSEGDATVVLSSFVNAPETQRYLARLILRRSVDPRMVAAVERVILGTSVDWASVDRQLSALADPADRLRTVSEAVAKAPEDPQGLIRLVKALAEAKRVEEAVQQGRRLAELGMLTPQLVQQLGDVLATQGLEDDAVRAYSEIVEFDPDNLASRRLLGDIYLAHGWYSPAYSQYKALSEANARDSLIWLRLASAAAGAQRVDEALRIERSVAESEGTPGPSDPRRFARLWSAARLSRLLAAPPADTGKDFSESITRKLKELQLFRGQGTLVLLTWEDLSVDLALATSSGGAPASIGEQTDAAVVGLSSVLMGNTEAQSVGLDARLRSVAVDRPVRLTRHEIRFDGKKFQVDVKPAELPAKATAVKL